MVGPMPAESAARARGPLPVAAVCRLDNVGDVLLAGPAVRAVARTSSKLVFVAGPRGRPAAELLPGVDQIVELQAPWIDPDLVPVRRPAMDAFVDTLAGIGVDQALVLGSFHQSPLPTALLLREAGVAVVAAECEDFPGSLLDVRHRVPEGMHEVERALSLAATLGHHLATEDSGRLSVRAGHGSPVPELPAARYVVLHPGASVPARSWQPDRYRAVAVSLETSGYGVVVTGGSGEKDVVEAVAAGTGALPLAGATDLAGLARVLAGAEVVVTGNTGPAHLSAAVGTPVVSLFAATVPWSRWRPYGVPAVPLGDQAIPCAGCRARVCPVPGHPCIGQVGPEQVVAAVAELAGRRPQAGRRPRPGAFPTGLAADGAV